MKVWRFLDAGRMDYEKCRALQLRLVDLKRLNSQFPDVTICVEHPPVFTVGRRAELGGLKVGVEFLQTMGVPLRFVERGGLITYHGPGQVVLYPIVDLRANGQRVIEFVEGLEEVMILALAPLGIRAERSALNRGVWVRGKKIGSLGIAVRGGITFHGLALNVNTDLEPFGWIDPCGLPGIQMTSVKELLGVEVELSVVKQGLRNALERVFGVRVESLEFVHELSGLSWEMDVFHGMQPNSQASLA